MFFTFGSKMNRRFVYSAGTLKVLGSIFYVLQLVNEELMRSSRETTTRYNTHA